MTFTQSGSATRNSIIIIFAVCAVLVFAVMLLPKGFSDDLTVIGKGTPAVVLTQDKNSVKSLEWMELLNRIRSDYADRVQFLAVDFNSEEGRAFSVQQGADGSELLLFDAGGVKQAVLAPGVDERQLRSDLDAL